MKKLLLALLLIAAHAVPALASDHTNLEENLPTELQDAYPTAFRNVELQGVVRYLDEGKEHRFLYQPIVEIGILPNTEFSISGILYSGNADTKGSGDLSSELFYNFNTESVWIPATALAVEGTFPTGEASRGVDVTTKLIFSKMPYLRTTLLHRLHLNLLWTYNGGKDEDERRNILKGILGFSMRAGKDGSFIIDYVREQKEMKGEHANLLEAGYRRQLTPFTLATLGGGVGMGADSEQYRVTVGFQHSF